MSNFPENEKTELNGNTAEEFSTVFSDPAVHRDIPQKKKRRLLAAIASILAVAVLAGGTVAVIKLIPEKEEETVSNPYAEDITVTEISSDDLTSVTVKNENGTLNLYSKREKAKDSSDSSEVSDDAEVVTWYLKGVDSALTDSSTISSFVQSAASITAMREITEKTAEDCGLTKPMITVNTVDTKSEKMTVSVGGESPDGSGYYVKTSLSDKIYLVDSSYVDTLSADKLYFAVSETMSAFSAPDGAEDYLSDEGIITSFDSITVKSSKFKDTLYVESNPNEALAQYAGYIIKKPTTRIAENLDGIISVFTSGLATTGAYSYDVSAKSLKAFGLDKPDFEMTMNIMGKTLTYKLALQKDGNYAAVNNDSKLVSRVTADSVAFVNNDIIDFYSSWICLYSIDDIDGLNIRFEDKDYKFGIKANSDEDAEDSYIITLGGKSIDCQSFQNFYQYLISVACTDYTVDKVSGEPDVVFDFSFKDKKIGHSIIEFTKANETRYQYSVDGVELGKVTSSSIKKLGKYLDKLANGEIIENVN